MADVTLFDLAEKRLAYLDQRQSVLAQNIANANTPNYQAHDLAPFANQLTLAQSAAALVRTDPMHLAGTGGGAGGLALSRPAELSADGNGVQLDTQLTKVADTDVNQELVSDIYRKYLNLYRTALGR